MARVKCARVRPHGWWAKTGDVVNLIDMRDAQRRLLQEAREDLKPMERQLRKMSLTSPHRDKVEKIVARLRERVEILSAGEEVVRRKRSG